LIVIVQKAHCKIIMALGSHNIKGMECPTNKVEGRVYDNDTICYVYRGYIRLPDLSLQKQCIVRGYTHPRYVLFSLT